MARLFKGGSCSGWVDVTEEVGALDSVFYQGNSQTHKHGMCVCGGGVP